MHIKIFTFEFILITVENNNPPPGQSQLNTLFYTHMQPPNVYTYLGVVIVTSTRNAKSQKELNFFMLYRSHSYYVSHHVCYSSLKDIGLYFFFIKYSTL